MTARWAPRRAPARGGANKAATRKISASARRRVVAQAAAAGPEDQPEDWELKYLFDGGCTVCNSLVKLLKSKRGHEKIWCAEVAALPDPKRPPHATRRFFFGGPVPPSLASARRDVSRPPEEPPAGPDAFTLTPSPHPLARALGVRPRGPRTSRAPRGLSPNR